MMTTNDTHTHTSFTTLITLTTFMTHSQIRDAITRSNDRDDDNVRFVEIYFDTRNATINDDELFNVFKQTHDDDVHFDCDGVDDRVDNASIVISFTIDRLNVDDMIALCDKHNVIVTHVE